MRGEGRLSKHIKHIQRPASSDSLGYARKKGRRGVCWGGGGGARLISASMPCACQSNILKQHMQGFATANYPALGTGTEKHLRRTIKRAGLVVCAVSKCWQMNMQLLNGPSRGLWAGVASLFQLLIFLHKQPDIQQCTWCQILQRQNPNQFAHLLSSHPSLSLCSSLTELWGYKDPFVCV